MSSLRRVEMEDGSILLSKSAKEQSDQQFNSPRLSYGTQIVRLPNTKDIKFMVYVSPQPMLVLYMYFHLTNFPILRRGWIVLSVEGDMTAKSQDLSFGSN